MSYQVLARKYRPKSFDTLVGQEHVVRALTHALEKGRLHHAYLFTGTRGVGKTTLSRILAKSFNCEMGITAQPCGKCHACMSIDAGRFVDYIEMDAASNRGVDEMAQLLEQAVYAPSNARFKVYMIDEVHMLTNHAFNSMLKTLEEPPEHVKFILATTDPQKIPVTVLSRCLQFNLKQMPSGHIVGHLENILNEEEIAFETAALRLLAHGAQGSMRDALSLTDQAIAYAAGKVTLDAVQGMLGALDQSYLIRILDALANKDGERLLGVADEMAIRSLSYNAALRDLGTLLHRIALAQMVPAALAEDIPERESILRLVNVFDPEEVQLFYQIAVHGRNELSLAPDEYAGFSITLLRMLAFRPEISGGEVSNTVGRSVPVSEAKDIKSTPQMTSSTKMRNIEASPARAALEAARNSSIKNHPAVAAVPVAGIASVLPWEDDISQVKEQTLSDVAELPAQKRTELSSINLMLSEVQSGLIAPSISLSQVSSQPVEQLMTALSSIEQIVDWDGNWPALAAVLPLRGVVQQLAQQSELIRWETNENVVQLWLRVPLETLCSATSVDKLAAVLSESFGRTVRIEIEIGTVEKTANAQTLADRQARQRQAEETIQSDPFVQTLMREFGATIVPGSIKPV